MARPSILELIANNEPAIRFAHQKCSANLAMRGCTSRA
jgi:hypothetical protein